jgi:hypothetical protein
LNKLSQEEIECMQLSKEAITRTNKFKEIWNIIYIIKWLYDFFTSRRFVKFLCLSNRIYFVK